MIKTDGLVTRDHTRYVVSIYMEDEYGASRKYGSIQVLVPKGVKLDEVKEEVKAANYSDESDGSVECAFDDACDKNGWEWDWERSEVDWVFDVDNNCDLEYYD